MKTKKKPTTAMQLPGALALAAAGAATQANAATVQITFANNHVGLSTGLTNFVADLTGDGTNELRGGYAPQSYATVGAVPRGYIGGAGVNGVGVGRQFLRAVAGQPSTMTGLVGIAFMDSRINGGTTTNGWVDLTSSLALNRNVYGVQINRLIFDDASTSAPTGITVATSGLTEWGTVPEPSSFALLALGAGGILTRRRQKRAA